MKFLILILLVSQFFVACNSTNNTEESTESEKSIESSLDEESESVPQLELLWETEENLETVESVLYYEKEDILFASCILGKPVEKDGSGFISKLNTDGSMKELKWADGLDAPKGSGILNGMLFVTNIDEIVAIMLDDPTKMKRFLVEGAQFLNDIAIGEGKVFVSDMATQKLHVLENEQVTTLRENHEGINGLYFDKGRLYLLDAQGLHSVNSRGEDLQTHNSKMTSGDGLVKLSGENEFIASRWKGEIWYVNGEEASKMFDSSYEEIQTADIGYNPAENMLYVPRFFSDKVSGMKFRN